MMVGLPRGLSSLYQTTDAGGLPEYWHCRCIGPAPCWLIGARSILTFSITTNYKLASLNCIALTTENHTSKRNSIWTRIKVLYSYTQMIRHADTASDTHHQWHRSVGVTVSQVTPSNCLRRLETLVLPSIFDTSLSSFMMWNSQSYPTPVLNKRMKF